MVTVAVAAFVAIFVVHVPFPLIVLRRGAGRASPAVRLRPDLFEVGVATSSKNTSATVIADDGASGGAHGTHGGSSWR